MCRAAQEAGAQPREYIDRKKETISLSAEIRAPQAISIGTLRTSRGHQTVLQFYESSRVQGRLVSMVIIYGCILLEYKLIFVSSLKE